MSVSGECRATLEDPAVNVEVLSLVKTMVRRCHPCDGDTPPAVKANDLSWEKLEATLEKMPAKPCSIWCQQ